MTGKEKSLTTFRVHTTEGWVDVEAGSPSKAAEVVKEQHPNVHIRKVKVVRGGDA